MKPENLVTSLEVSKRLKELGVKQESFFKYHDFYYPTSENDDYISGLTYCLCSEEYRVLKVFGEEGEHHWNEGTIDALNYTDWEHSRCEIRNDICSAFTAEEIGELLISITTFYLNISTTVGNDYLVKLIPFKGRELEISSIRPSLAEAMALTYIQLKEKNLI